MRQINLFFIFALQWCLCSSQIEENDCDIDSRIQQVENGLRHPIQIDGDSLKFTIHERMKLYHVPGVTIAVVNNGKIEWAKGYGSLGVDLMKEVDTSTLFQAASVSKAVSSLGALQLVDKGKIDLDENVNMYLKTWKLKNNSFTAEKYINLRGLLTHTAGLTVSGFIGYAHGESLPTLNQILDGIEPANSQPVISDKVPGTVWQYSGGGYTVMQKLVEDMTESNFATLMENTIFSAIGMNDSTFRYTLAPSWQQRASVGHLSSGKKVDGNWNRYPESTAAGLWTTPTDLALYIIEIQKSLKGELNKVLSKQMVEKMLTKHLGNWGLGPELYGDNESLAFGHTGSNIGYKCLFFAFAHIGQGAVVMTNSDNGNILIAEIIKSIAVTYDWSLQKPIVKTVVKLTPEKLSTFVGTYFTSQMNLNLEITSQNTHLLIKQLWDESQLDLYPESDVDFFIKETGILIKFESSNEGVITGLQAINLIWSKIK